MAFSPGASTAAVFALPAMANSDGDSPAAKKHRGWIKSNPDCRRLAFHLGNTRGASILASRSKKRRVCRKSVNSSPCSQTVRARCLRSNVVIQCELVRMGPSVDGLDFVLHLIVDPGFDQFLAEDVSLEKEVMILFQSLQGFFKRSR